MFIVYYSKLGIQWNFPKEMADNLFIADVYSSLN